MLHTQQQDVAPHTNLSLLAADIFPGCSSTPLLQHLDPAQTL